MVFDNQQERLAYLAGLIDGEGTVTISGFFRQYQDREQARIQPLVSISNTDPLIIEALHEILDSVRVGHLVKWRQPRQENWRRQGTVQVLGYKRIRTLLRLVLPYLIGKKQRAEVVLRLCERRADLPRKSPYTIEDLNALEEVRQLNVGRHASIPRDYTLGALRAKI